MVVVDALLGEGEGEHGGGAVDCHWLVGGWGLYAGEGRDEEGVLECACCERREEEVEEEGAEKETERERGGRHVERWLAQAGGEGVGLWTDAFLSSTVVSCNGALIQREKAVLIHMVGIEQMDIMYTTR